MALHPDFVLDRIYKDLQDLRIFFEDPVIPDNGAGRRKLAVKVVDIFGNDTMTIVEVTV